MKSDEHAQQHNELHGLVEAAHKALSSDVERLQKPSLEQGSRLTKLGSGFDDEVSNGNAKFDDCEASLKSQCQANHKSLKEEGIARARDIEELKVSFGEHGDAYMDLAEVLASSHR